MTLIPAHAGVIPTRIFRRMRSCSYPRARGGDPKNAGDESPGENLSPRTRG